MTQRLRGTVIGCGFFAENHLNAWASIQDIELVAICDLDAHKAASAAARFGAPRHYTDAATMASQSAMVCPKGFCTIVGTRSEAASSTSARCEATVVAMSTKSGRSSRSMVAASV